MQGVWEWKEKRILLKKGDITQEKADAIVNAANPLLAGGGGVDGAIHRAAGLEMIRYCGEIRKKRGGCPRGEAVITPGGNLFARFVIHTVGPIWRGGGEGEEEVLRKAYRNSLLLAEKTRLSIVSFPSISTGVYRFPLDLAAAIALRTTKDFLKSSKNVMEVRFLLFSSCVFDAFEKGMRRFQGEDWLYRKE